MSATRIVPAPSEHGPERADPARRDLWLRGVVALAFAALLLRVVAAYPFLDLDVFHQLALSREALALGRIPTQDLWAYTRTLPVVVHHEWGTGAVLYAVAVATGWGWAALAVLRIVLVAAISGAVYLAARRNGGSDALLVVLAPVSVAFLVIGLSPLRAQLFTFLGVAVLMLVTAADRAGRRTWVGPWLVFWVLWLNLHGGFVLGLVLYGLYVLERVAEEVRAGRRPATAVRRHGHLLLAGVAMGLGTLVNPYGWAYVPYLWKALAMQRALIGEWAPIWSSSVKPALQISFGFALVVTLYAFAKRRTFWLPGAALLLASAWFTLQHQRMAPVFGIVWLALLPAYLAPTPLGAMLRGFATRAAVPVGVVAAVAVVSGAWKATESRFWELRLPQHADGHGWTAPTGAVRHLRQTQFNGNLMTFFEEGAYISWELYPAVRVGMDSRYEAAYPEGAIERNVALYNGASGWERVLAETRTDAVLVPVAAPLDGSLAGHSEWSPVYRDAGHAVYVRSGHGAAFGGASGGRAGREVSGTSGRAAGSVRSLATSARRPVDRRAGQSSDARVLTRDEQRIGREHRLAVRAQVESGNP